jgi:hypothetical protein
VGHGTKFKVGKNRLGANMLTRLSSRDYIIHKFCVRQSLGFNFIWLQDMLYWHTASFLCQKKRSENKFTETCRHVYCKNPTLDFNCNLEIRRLSGKNQLFPRTKKMLITKKICFFISKELFTANLLLQNKKKSTNHSTFKFWNVEKC